MGNKYKAEAKAARKKRNWMNHCGKKKAFKTEQEAIDFKSNGTVYRCKSCGLWHRSEAFNTLKNVLRKRCNKKGNK